MKKVNLLKYGLTALMMAFAMTLCYSCSNDDDDPTVEEPTPPTNGKFVGDINDHDYVVLAGYKWATENVGEVNGVEASAGPDAEDNNWGCYYYTQDNAKKAAASWGGTWTLPTEAQWQALIDECDWTWKKDYYYRGKTMNGCIVSDKNEPSVFIFLPAAGACPPHGLNFVGNQGRNCYYWSSDDGKNLDFYGSGLGRYGMYRSNSDLGMAVRPVSE